MKTFQMLCIPLVKKNIKTNIMKILTLFFRLEGAYGMDIVGISKRIPSMTPIVKVSRVKLLI